MNKMHARDAKQWCRRFGLRLMLSRLGIIVALRVYILMGKEKVNLILKRKTFNQRLSVCVQTNIHKYIFICYSQFKYFFLIIYPSCIYIEKVYFFSIYLL